jgi:hypothetical protein
MGFFEKYTEQFARKVAEIDSAALEQAVEWLQAV